MGVTMERGEKRSGPWRGTPRDGRAQRRLTHCIGAALLAAAGAWGAPAAGADGVFVAAAEPSPPSAQGEPQAALPHERRRFVKLQLEKLAVAESGVRAAVRQVAPRRAPGDQLLRLNLFADANFDGVVERTFPVRGGHALRGRLVDVPEGRFTLAVRGATVTRHGANARGRLRGASGGRRSARRGRSGSGVFSDATGGRSRSTGTAAGRRAAIVLQRDRKGRTRCPRTGARASRRSRRPRIQVRAGAAFQSAPGIRRGGVRRTLGSAWPGADRLRSDGKRGAERRGSWAPYTPCWPIRPTPPRCTIGAVNGGVWRTDKRHRAAPHLATSHGPRQLPLHRRDGFRLGGSKHHRRRHRPLQQFRAGGRRSHRPLVEPGRRRILAANLRSPAGEPEHLRRRGAWRAAGGVGGAVHGRRGPQRGRWRHLGRRRGSALWPAGIGLGGGSERSGAPLHLHSAPRRVPQRRRRRHLAGRLQPRRHAHGGVHAKGHPVRPAAATTTTPNSRLASTGGCSSRLLVAAKPSTSATRTTRAVVGRRWTCPSPWNTEARLTA